jgi:hypothetical protein
VKGLTQGSFESAIYGGGLPHVYGYEMIQVTNTEYLFSASKYNHTFAAAGNYLIKINQVGEIIWNKAFAMPCGDANAFYLRLLSDSTYLMAGGGNQYCQGNGYYYGYCSRLDTSGSVQFTVFMGGDTTNFIFFDVIADLDGGFVCVGMDDHFATYGDAMIIKYDAHGNLVFSKKYLHTTGTDQSSFQRIIQHADSSYYVLASVLGQPALIHLNQNGDSLSSVPIIDSLGPNEYYYPMAIKQYNERIICNISIKNTNNQLARLFYFNYDIISDHYWKTQQATSYSKTFIPLLDEDKIVLAACPNNFGSLNSSIERRDSSDHLIWSHCIHPEYVVKSNGRALNASWDGGILYTSEIDSINQGNYESIYYLKLDSNGIILAEKEVFMNDILNVCPNPSEDEVIILFDNQIDRVDIYEHSGKLVLSSFPDNHVVSIVALREGVYFMKLISVRRHLVTRIIKM